MVKPDDVTHQSCGCIFCDMGLEPEWVDAQAVHYIPKEDTYVECRNPDSQPGPPLTAAKR